jgi:hypothetical protein
MNAAKYLMIAVMVFGFSSVAMADEPSSSLDWQDVLVMLLKQVLPIMGAFFSGYITKAMLWLMDAAGAKWSPILTTIIGMVTSGVSAALLGQSPDMINATAALGAGTGVASHVVMQSKPLATEPKQEPAA